MKNKKIAIDIVLSLPEEIEKLCIKLNKESDKTKYVSFTKGNKPHISLGMGSIFIDSLSNFQKEINNHIKIINSFEITISKLETFKFRDYYIYQFSVLLNNYIVRLHNIVMDIIIKYNSGESTINMFKEKEKIDELTLSWVNDYAKISLRLNYKPHITLGVGIPKNKPILPINFKVKKINIFQLGPYCTCKEKLSEFILK